MTKKERKKKRENTKRYTFPTVIISRRKTHRRPDYSPEMEGVGARTGRSSSRYGTTTVFNGPVRKWKKDWVPIPPSSSSSSNSNQNHHPNNNNNNNHSSTNGNVNGSSVSHLRLYKWTPINKDNSSNDNDNTNNKISNNNDDDTNGTKNSANDDVVSDEPGKKKFKYIPVNFPFLLQYYLFSFV